MSLITPDKTDNHLLSSYLTSQRSIQVVISLNVLLEASSNADENHALGVGGEHVIQALVQVFERCIGYEGGQLKNATKRKRKRPYVADREETFKDVLKKSWIPMEDRPNSNSPLWDNTDLRRWYKFCRKTLPPPIDSTHPKIGLSDDNSKIIEVVVMIFRNLSYVAGNIRFLCHSTGVIRVLSACLHYHPAKHQNATNNPAPSSSEGNPSGNPSSSSTLPPRNACLHSLQTLINLASYLSITAKKIFTDLVLIEPKKHASLLPLDGHGYAHSLGIGGVSLSKRFDTRGEKTAHVSPPPHCTMALHSLCAPHSLVLSSLFPLLAEVIRHTTHHRVIIVTALELMKELVDNPDHLPVFLVIPDDLLSRLVELLYIPRLGPDSLEYIDPTHNHVSRISSLKLLSGYDASVDFETRDRAVELLERLSSLSPDIKRRLGAIRNVPRVYDYLVPILETTVGRSDAPQLAGRVLANLAMVEENRMGLRVVERRLVDLAGRDAHVANVVFNCLLNQY